MHTPFLLLAYPFNLTPVVYGDLAYSGRLRIAYLWILFENFVTKFSEKFRAEKLSRMMTVETVHLWQMRLRGGAQRLPGLPIHDSLSPV